MTSYHDSNIDHVTPTTTITTNDREWSRNDWYAVLQTACFRLNSLTSESNTIDSIMRLFFKCTKHNSLDMIELSPDYYVTNFCALLNGIFAFRDTKGRTYRISVVFSDETTKLPVSSCETSNNNSNNNRDNQSVSHFIVTVKPSSEDDYVFPLLGE